jgi:MFS family permease
MDVLAPGKAGQGSMDRTALRFVILLGFVSLFGDMTYEGARSIIGPFLGTLGASAAIVGIAAGFGELVGYAIRLLSGYIGDRTGQYWAVTIFGYILNLFAVPLLALAGSWQIAVVLIVAERMGRALRAPTRDAMLSHAATRTGAGWAFGLHEAMDTTEANRRTSRHQRGLVFRARLPEELCDVGDSRVDFHGRAACCAIAVPGSSASRGRRTDPSAQHAAGEVLGLLCRGCIHRRRLRRFFAFGLPLRKTAVVAPPWVPILYAVAMIAAAVAALALGRWFNRVGIRVLVPATVVSALSAPLAFLGGSALVTLGVVFWGIGMGAQESVMRAVIGSMAPRERRGTAFGLFHTVFGVAWFAGSALLGIIYDHSVVGVAALSLVLQLLALPLLFVVITRWSAR